MDAFRCGAFILFNLLLCRSQDLGNVCNTKESCSDCIKELGCIWCSNPKNQSIAGRLWSRCENENLSDINVWCDNIDLIAPKSKAEIVKNDPLKTKTASGSVQISPQHIKLTMRRGEEFPITFQYQQVEDYPVDLYYIMDLSQSMRKHKDKLSKLGDRLTKAMKNITKNFRLGFGSFVDKTDMPFISTVPEKLDSPCQSNTACVRAYSFKNHLSLTLNTDLFATEVTRADLSGNIDFPEGGFDAIMQAIVCKDVIGWRQRARHLLVLSTDANYHIAGDGKLAGIVEPNDARCHMENNFYTDDLIYDYPSVSQINWVSKQNNINIIFAVVKEQEAVYKALQARIDNSAAGILDSDSSNVIKLVLDNYEKLVDSITMTDNSGDNVEIKYSSTCAPFKEPSTCGGIRVGVETEFTATIKALECTHPKSGPQIIDIKPEALNESLTIELEVICDCPCEKSGPAFELHSARCNGHGTLKCGVCGCEAGRFGKMCECDSTTATTDDSEACKRNKDAEMCSGLGKCKCGKCECNQRPDSDQLVYGQFCECDNYSCARSNGVACSGPDRGYCDCGSCNCKAGWTGEACECLHTNSTCIAPGGDGTVCSGHGSCVCGYCICSQMDKNRYSGQYCEECPSCSGQRCEELKHCVECLAHRTGIHNENDCKVKCSTSFEVDVVDKILDKLDNESDSERKVCRAPDNSGCTIVFEYFYDSYKQLHVNAQRDKICSKDINILIAVLGVIASIVIAGLVLLIVWKISTSIYDKREFEKFENERAAAKWGGGDNPLYKKATSTFQNPTFGRQSSIIT